MSMARAPEPLSCLKHVLCTAIGLLLAACSAETTSSLAPPDSGPADAAPEPGAAASVPPDLPPEEPGPFRVQCLSRWPIVPAGESGLTDPGAQAVEATERACVLRGRVSAVHDTLIPDASELGHEAVRALAVEIEPDDHVPCALEKELRDPAIASAGFTRAKVVLVVFGARIRSALRPGSGLCGWSKLEMGPSLGDSGWEGSLSSASAGLLGAWSHDIDAREPALLGRSWKFTREGPVEKVAIAEGGAFLRHAHLRVWHGGASAYSSRGSEGALRSSDGVFAVSATSRLTEGPVPPFVTPQNGYAFYAVRADLPAQ